MATKAAGAAPAIDIGIPSKNRKEIADGLSRLLADTYTLYLKTHNYHWNVTGPMFNTLHLMFETQYNELALAVDLIAERIRALGFPAPGTYADYAQLSSIKERPGVPSAKAMIADLVEGPGSGRAHRAVDLPHGRAGERRAERRSTHPAHAGAREDGVDAAVDAREVARPASRAARGGHVDRQ